jgi:competence protein ComEC
MPFWDRTLDLTIATHADEDHVGGLTAVFERYQVERLLTNGLTDDSATAYNLVLEAAGAAGTEVHPAVAGEVFDLGDGVRLEVLHPGSDPLNSDNRNDHSVSVRLVYGHFTLLLTGDAEVEGEQAILQRDLPMEALVFKAGHHGANNASNDFFLAAVQPQYIVVSAGAGNRFGHPAEEMLQRASAIGATVLRTDERGTIEVRTDGRQMWWQAYPQQDAP